MNPRAPALLLASVLLASPACSRDTPAAPSDAGSSAPSAPLASTPSPEPRTAPAARPEDRSLPAAEATRKEIRSLDADPLLALHRDAVFAHFGERDPLPLELHVEALPGDRRAVLIQSMSWREKPLVLVAESDGTRAFSKDQPLAGIVPGVREMTVVRGADSAVGISFCDAEGRRAALRMWTAEGGIFADYEVLELAHCEVLSALYWPGRGHLVAAAGGKEARVARIDEQGMRVFDRAGLEAPWKPAPGAGASILVDTDDTFVLLGAGTAETAPKRAEEALFAMRYDESGKALWPAPLAVARTSGDPPKRPRAHVVATGKIEVEISEGTSRRRFELTSGGSVIRLPERR